MSQRFRTSEFGHVDRETPVTFSFDGQRLDGFAGDTLASALLANGIHLVGRSFKYHRPRGILSAGSEEPNALVTVGEDGRATPNLRASSDLLHHRMQFSAYGMYHVHACEAGGPSTRAHPHVSSRLRCRSPGSAGTR